MTPWSSLRKRPAGSVPAYSEPSTPCWSCQIRVTVRPDSFVKRGPSLPRSHRSPRFVDRDTIGPQCSLVTPA